MNNIGSYDQFQPIRIRENLVAKYNAFFFNLRIRLMDEENFS